jgi:hypothetical protein
MKARFLILIGVVLALLGVVAWRLTRPIATPLRTPSVALTSPTPATTIPTTPTPAPQPLAHKPPIKGEYQGESDPRWQWWHAMEKHDPAFEWKAPINFYGKVVDQNDEPLAGATVKFVWNDISSTGSSYEETTSDANGLFSLIDKKGKGVSVSASKNGYHVGNAASGSFEYVAFFEWNYHEPNENKPIVFRLIKKIDSEPLIVGTAFNTLSYEQRIYYYDLQQGRLSRQSPPSDGLRFAITRSQAPQGQPFDWTWAVDGVNAMLRPTTDEFPQVAPVDGYLASWNTQETAMAKSFQREGTVRLYVRTNDGRYGVVDLQLSHPNDRKIGPTLRVNSYVNPSGSRNLEYDPSKVVKARN